MKWKYNAETNKKGVETILQNNPTKTWLFYIFEFVG